jgi:DNA mismatch repair protein MutS
MNFEIDKQTLKDLDLFGDVTRKQSVFDFYNQTKTTGGKDYLLKLMQNPSTRTSELKERTESIRLLSALDFNLTITARQFDFIEHYLRLNVPVLRNNLVDAVIQSLMNRIKSSNEYYLIQSGIQQLKFLFIHLKNKISIVRLQDFPESFSVEFNKISQLIENDDFSCFWDKRDKMPHSWLNKLDFMIRNKHHREVSELIRFIYLLDAYVSIGKVAKEKGLAYPEYLNDRSQSISLRKLFHPLLPDAVPYDFEISEPKNLCFLTGPNMAGKSTFLKSMGLAVYLSHLGFPVPAEKMTLSIYHGLITTINLSDNLLKGYSHYYGEVKRVKEIAIKLKEKNRLFVICDELFRGTNVKDAFNASLLIIKSFAEINKSTFCISSHITELAENLDKLPTIDFKYFDARLENDTPKYEYILLNGISHERLGMHILKKERILEILSSIQYNPD